MKNAKLVAKSHDAHTSKIQITPNITIGGKTLFIVGGPCSIESMPQMETIARALLEAPVLRVRVTSAGKSGQVP